MELSELQQKIINDPSPKIVVISAAASGKTTLITEKVRQILKTDIDPKQVAVITFTNNAAAELKSRLGADYKEGLFIGTIHSLANYFLLSKGIKTNTYLDDENFDGLFELVKMHPECVKHLEYIILDEAQDSDLLQHQFLFDMIAPPNFFVVGDARQSIYQFRGAKPSLLLSMCKWRDVKVYDMNENYRNSINILNFAKGILKNSQFRDSSVPMRKISGIVHQTYYSHNEIINLINSKDQYKDWAILTRTNRQLENVSILLKSREIPFDSFKRSDLTRDELMECMEKNTVKLLTIHSAKGLEWNNVIVIGALFRSQEELNVSYVAATRARNTLIWMQLRPKHKEF